MHLVEPLQITDRSTHRDDLDSFDLRDDLEFHGNGP